MSPNGVTVWPGLRKQAKGVSSAHGLSGFDLAGELLGSRTALVSLVSNSAQLRGPSAEI